MAVSDQQVLQWLKDNPNATDAQIAQAAAQAGVSADQLSRVTGVSSGDITSRASAAGVELSPSNQFDSLINAAYGSIGRTGLGTGMNQIDQAGYDYWSNLLSTGQVKPEDFQTVFNNAVNEYVANNPTDQYTQYVQDYQASNPSTTTQNTTQATTQATNTAENGISDSALKDWIDTNSSKGATAGQLYTAALNQGVGLDQIQRVTGLSTQDLLKEQILSTSDSSQWSGEGWGSAEKNAADMAKILEGVGITNVLDLGITTTDGGQTYYNKATGEAITMPSTYGERQTGNAFGGTFAGSGNTGYRVSLNEQGQPVFYTTGASSSDLGSIAPLLAIGGMIAAPWLSTQIGALTGLTGAGLSAATGATLGGAGSLLTGGDLGDIAKGAFLGGAGGYVMGGGLSSGNNSIYSLANGTPNLDYMGGGQGLTSTSGAGLSSMGGAQGMTILTGAQSASLADALASFGGVDPKVLSDMGLGQGITYVTPSGIVTENGTVIGGDVISEFGKNTGFNLDNWLNQNVGGSIGDNLKYLDTGVNSGQVDLGPTTLDSALAKTPTTTTTDAPSASDLLKLASAAGMLNTAGNIGGGGGAPVNPTQGVPVNNPAYYQAIQQYYNTYMPNQPADVATPLQQWYSGAYKA